jgi:hypothetical protein
MSRLEENLSSRTHPPATEMDRQMSVHLTDEQFTELLLGGTSRSVSEHLKVCSQCSEEAERVSVAIGSFEQQSRLWAERETATHTRIRARRSAYSWLGPAPAWAAAAAATVIVFGLVFHSTGRIGHSAHPQPEISTAASQPAAGPSTLQSDNALLAAIEGELRVEDAPSANVYGLDLGVRTVHTKPGKTVLN